MGQRTEIEWCDSTVNPTTGCDGCELWSVTRKGGPCYAGNLHEQRLAKAMPELYAPDFTEVRLAPGRIAKAAAWPDLTGTRRPDKPWLDGLPRVIFVGDMGDVFSRDVPFDFLRDELIDVALSPKGGRHVWMVLTKQARRLFSFAEWLYERGTAWPANVWVGVSVTGTGTLGRVPWLEQVPAAVRFVSLEPQLCEVTFGLNLDGIRLVIQGGESDQGAHVARDFDAAWARSVRDECRAAGVAYFLKQLGSRAYDSRSRSPRELLTLKDHHGGDPAEWPEDLRGCREFPRAMVAGEARR